MLIAFDWLKKNLYKLTFKCLSSEKSNFHKQISVINFSNILNFPYHLLNNSLGYCLLPVYLFITHEKFASESSSLLKAITLRIFFIRVLFFRPTNCSCKSLLKKHSNSLESLKRNPNVGHYFSNGIISRGVLKFSMLAFPTYSFILMLKMRF